MVKTCCVTNCSYSWNPYSEISLFSFPWKNEELMKIWLNVIPTKCNITHNTRICSQHFEEDCIEQKFVRRGLKQNAIPTIFPIVNCDTKSMYNYAASTVPKMDSQESYKVSLQSLTRNDHDYVKNYKIDIHFESENLDSTDTSSSSHKVQTKTVATQISPRRLSPSDRELELQRKIRILQGKLRRRDQRISNVTQLIRTLKKVDKRSEEILDYEDIDIVLK